jgi:hydrogenase maturation protease
LKILILGIGNILFGDEGIGPHLANLLDQKYHFVSSEHSVDIIDGGTLAQRLIPIITEYDKVVLIDCVNVDDGEVGEVYSFDFDKVPHYITWQGSAHEVEMLQTLQMIELMGDLPPVKIVGVVPFVIGEDSTFSLTDALLEASLTMEQVIIEYLASLDIASEIKDHNIKLQDITATTYLKGAL